MIQECLREVQLLREQEPSRPQPDVPLAATASRINRKEPPIIPASDLDAVSVQSRDDYSRNGMPIHPAERHKSEGPDAESRVQFTVGGRAADKGDRADADSSVSRPSASLGGFTRPQTKYMDWASNLSGLSKASVGPRERAGHA